MEKKFIRDYWINDKLDIEKVVKDYTSYLYKIIKSLDKSVLSEEDIEDIIYDAFFVIWANEKN